MSVPASRWLMCVAAAIGGALAHSSSAHAFSDPQSFKLSPVVAGGGGRFFTGSPADGYTCKACHEGGVAPTANVLGLPLSGYRPKTRYEVTIEWPARFEKISLAFELTDSLGAAAGSLRLPPREEFEDPELCDPASDQILAAQLSELASGRQLINVPDCGSKRVRFLWTAPETDLGPVWFAGSMVSSDGESDLFHDGVTDFGRVLGSPGVASSTTAECSVAGGRVASAASGWLSAIAVSAMLVGVGMLRSARRRKLRA